MTAADLAKGLRVQFKPECIRNVRTIEQWYHVNWSKGAIKRRAALVRLANRANRKTPSPMHQPHDGEPAGVWDARNDAVSLTNEGITWKEAIDRCRQEALASSIEGQYHTDYMRQLDRMDPA